MLQPFCTLVLPRSLSATGLPKVRAVIATSLSLNRHMASRDDLSVVKGWLLAVPPFLRTDVSQADVFRRFRIEATPYNCSRHDPSALSRATLQNGLTLSGSSLWISLFRGSQEVCPHSSPRRVTPEAHVSSQVPTLGVLMSLQDLSLIHI